MTSYQLIFENRAEYMYVLVTGEINSKTDEQIDAEIKLECEKHEQNKALVDIRESSSRLSFLENFVAATSFRERMGAFINAVAIVDSDVHKENSELFELAAANRAAKVKFFTSTIVAEKWLVGDCD